MRIFKRTMFRNLIEQHHQPEKPYEGTRLVFYIQINFNIIFFRIFLPGLFDNRDI